jgi:hypothetical protein
MEFNSAFKGLIVLRETPNCIFVGFLKSDFLRIQNVDVTSVYKLYCICYIFFVGNI